MNRHRWSGEALIEWQPCPLGEVQVYLPSFSRVPVGPLSVPGGAAAAGSVRLTDEELAAEIEAELMAEESRGRRRGPPRARLPRLRDQGTGSRDVACDANRDGETASRHCGDQKSSRFCRQKSCIGVKANSQPWPRRPSRARQHDCSNHCGVVSMPLVLLKKKRPQMVGPQVKKGLSRERWATTDIMINDRLTFVSPDLVERPCSSGTGNGPRRCPEAA